jgi:tRNA/rRNA methyltransferase
MKNMGLRDLTLVGPKLRRLNFGGVMAVHARDLLENARVVADLSQAVSDCTLVVGTTRRGGLYRAAADGPEMLAPLIVDHARQGKVALLFGPEDHGLSNDDLKHCQRLIAIDTSPDYPSLNLAQAVLLCCYELRRAVLAGVPSKSQLDPAPAADVEFLFERLQSAFLRIGFLNPQNPDHIMFALRRLFGRAQLEGPDVRILLGLARQIEWYGRSGAGQSAGDQVG